MGTLQGYQRGDCHVGSTADGHHLPIWLKDEETLKRTPENKSKQKVVEELAISDRDYPQSFMMFSMFITPSHQKRSIRSLRERLVPMSWE